MSEFHPHSFAKADVTHNRLGLNKASGTFKKQRQFAAHWPYMLSRKGTALPSPGSRETPRVTAAVPGDRHAFRQGNTRVSADCKRSFTGHKIWGAEYSVGGEPHRRSVPG